MSAAAQTPPSLLDAHLDASQRELLERCESLARERLAPLAAQQHEGLNRPLVRALAAEGLLAKLFQRVDGRWSPRVGAMDLCLIREGLARACTAAETAFALQGLGSYPLLQSGSVTLCLWFPVSVATPSVPLTSRSVTWFASALSRSWE